MSLGQVKYHVGKYSDAMTASRYSAKNIIPEGDRTERLTPNINAQVLFRHINRSKGKETEQVNTHSNEQMG